MEGKLFIVPTPIGNLKDITIRALEVLNEVEMIAAEDTRHTIKLLNHFNIKKHLFSYHKFNEYDKGDEIVKLIKEGRKIALVSDAGTPGISDPGSILISKCIEENIDFEVLPGATAITTALVGSGLDSSKFIFRGFLPRERKEKNIMLENIKLYPETIIIYESPHRLIVTLKSLEENLGDRTIAICRELTKLHEQIIRCRISQAISYYEEKSPRGEYVLVIEGKSQKEAIEDEKKLWEDLSIEEHIIKYIKENNSKKESIKMVAKDRKLPKSEVYKYSLNIKSF
ncbi:16S rRNA (cytidine(1402)-2'-O)-methyltransferase [Clostridium grantii]|uniref:Ribosomal RNA small subunit methyltransferase I n=1 Tax=Clostridium grantii DSM 8605 TaxID=1121316 RepID=A0A1M5XRK1_9CLOT|nr:16S rRNA (cytidine(1402)-2'-O)-methyltransferase [Clostridium grantii]SHI02174.1 16S rRNA (cytidine1402-2'-O)-methyltransferase [Clostridium grantii DSM 8605]